MQTLASSSGSDSRTCVTCVKRRVKGIRSAFAHGEISCVYFKKTRHNEDRLTKPLSPSQIRSNKSLSLTHVHFLRLVAVHSECRQDGKKHSRQ